MQFAGQAIIYNEFNFLNQHSITASAMCLSETVPDVTFGRFTWPETRAGLVVFIPCPKQIPGAAEPITASRAW